LSFFSFFPTILLGQKTGNCFSQNYAEKNRLVQNFLKNHPQEPTSARDWKVEKFKNPAIFL
jgi:hypothetical protein